MMKVKIKYKKKKSFIKRFEQDQDPEPDQDPEQDQDP